MSTKTPKEHRLQTAAGEICWYEWGERSAKPSLLLLHATGFHARCWDQVIAHIPEGLHVIVPDQRGHGKTFKPDLISDWPEDAADVIAVLENVATAPAFAIGHSKGGVVAAFAAARRPDLFNQLLLIDPVVLPADLYWQGVDKQPVDPDSHPVSRRRNQWESAAQMVAHFSTRAPYDQWEAKVLEDYCEFGLCPADDGAGFQLACPPRLEASVYLGSVLADPASACACVPCPVTVLRGRSGERRSVMDFSVSPTRADLATLFPQGQDMQWNDHSHFIPMEATARLADLIAQLAA